jgi:hypothetical protein
LETAAPQLDPEIVDGIEDLLLEAKNATERGDPDGAARACMQVWEQLPEPKYQWDFSYVFLHGMVTYLRSARRNYDELVKIVEGYISSKYFDPEDYGPYFWLGTLAYERGDTEAAYQYFEKANKMTGGRCFADQDPRYRAFFKETRALRKP